MRYVKLFCLFLSVLIVCIFVPLSLAVAAPSQFTPTLRGSATNPGLSTTVIDGNFSGIATNANWAVATLTNSASLLSALPDETGTGVLVFNTNPTLAGATVTGILTANQITASSGILSSSAGIGYTTGSGGTVTQITSRTTGVTLNKANGKITLTSDTLAANTATQFTLTNSLIGANDFVLINHVSGGTLGLYNFSVTPSAGSAVITVRNNSASASPTETPVLQFLVLKGSVI